MGYTWIVKIKHKFTAMLIMFTRVESIWSAMRGRGADEHMHAVRTHLQSQEGVLNG